MGSAIVTYIAPDVRIGGMMEIMSGKLVQPCKETCNACHTGAKNEYVGDGSVAHVSPKFFCLFSSLYFFSKISRHRFRNTPLLTRSPDAIKFVPQTQARQRQLRTRRVDGYLLWDTGKSSPWAVTFLLGQCE